MSTARDALAGLDRATIAACWPQLGAVLAGARCEPAEAIPFNELATALRDVILEQGF